MPPALQFLVLTFAGWVNRHQDDLIEYLREENRVLREHLGPRPLRLTDAQRRRLAVRGHKLGRRVLRQVAGIVTPDTILRWYRRLIAKKYDGSACRRRGALVHGSELMTSPPSPERGSRHSVTVGHAETGHGVEDPAGEWHLHPLPRQRATRHGSADDRLVSIDRVLDHGAPAIA